MITRENIEECYRKYGENMEREERLRERALRAKDQESWLDDLRWKSRELRRLYVENESMLNLYVRPFLSGEVQLTEELADVFLKQITEFYDAGHVDDVLCADVALVLEPFFRQAGKRNEWLWTCNFLGRIYNTYDTAEDYQKSRMYFECVRSGFADYFSINDPKLRVCILNSFYNCPVVLVNGRKYFNEGQLKRVQETLKDEIAQAVAVYDDPAVNALDGERYDLQVLKGELLRDVYGNWVCGLDRNEKLEGEFAQLVDEVLTQAYEKNRAESRDLYSMDDTIYTNYWKCQYYCGKITAHEFVRQYLDYCKYVREHGTLEEEGEAFIYGRYFRVCMYDIPNLLEQTEALPAEERDEVRRYCIRTWSDFVRELPRVSYASYVNVAIQDVLYQMLTYVDEETFDFHFLLDITINRDETTMLHAALVRRVARVVMRTVLDERPELLVGLLGTENVSHVLERREKFITFVGEAALIHDIGKLGLMDVISHQTRKMSEREMARIRRHPDMGCRIVAQAGSAKCYRDIIRGHHRTYDGKGGYPAEFDNTASPVRFFIDLIRICDCMDAATDRVGRNYAHGKTISEFIEELEIGSGRLYNPDLVELLKGNQELQNELAYLCTSGRIRAYYEAYQDFLADRQREAVHLTAADAERKEQTDYADMRFLLELPRDICAPLREIVEITRNAAQHLDDRAQIADDLARIGNVSERLLDLLDLPGEKRDAKERLKSDTQRKQKEGREL